MDSPRGYAYGHTTHSHNSRGNFWVVLIGSKKYGMWGLDLDLRLVSLKCIAIGVTLILSGFVFSFDFFAEAVEFLRGNTVVCVVTLVVIWTQSNLIKTILELD
jgi:hypothetical protein